MDRLLEGYPAPAATRTHPPVNIWVGDNSVVGAASIGTEIMYQRYLWFLAGLGLAWPGFTGKTGGETLVYK